jgi:hypothetical protein
LLFCFQRSFPTTITKPFFAYRKDWSRVGVATLEKIGRDWKKDWKKDWLKIGCFFLFPQTTRVMPEKGKGMAQRGQDTREGGSSHEKRATKKSKTQMAAQEKNLKWMLTDEFRKGVAFVEDQNKRWTTICTHPSGGDLLKDKNLRALINEGFQPNVSCAATASSNQAALFATAASSREGSCAFQVRLQTQHAPTYYVQWRVFLSM